MYQKNTNLITIKLDEKLKNFQTHEDIIPILNDLFQNLSPSQSYIIEFPKGEYYAFPQHTVKKSYYQSNTTDINPRNTGIFLENKSNIIIDGKGSTFLFHDQMSAFTLDSCSNITVKNLNIDWEIPLGAEAEIVKTNYFYVDIRLDSKKYPYRIKCGKIIFLNEFSEDKWWGVMEFNPKDRIIPIDTGDHSLGLNWRTYFARQRKNNIIR